MAWIRHENDLIESGSKFYNSWNLCPCITGTVAGGVRDYKGRPGATVLDNCVGFAVGAFNETFIKNYDADIASGKTADNSKAIAFYEKNKHNFFNPRFPFNINSMAYYMLDKIRVSAGKQAIDFPNKTNELPRAASAGILYDYIRPFTDKPPVGGLIMWESCHVAYIDAVSEDGNTIHALHSGWGNPGWTTIVTGGYKPHGAEHVKDLSSQAYTRYKGKCLGYLANPAIDPYESSGDDTDTGLAAPVIEDIIQVSATKLTLSGHREVSSGYSSHSKFYYKWDGVASQNDYDGVIDTDVTQFSIDIVKPRESKSISVLPAEVSIYNEETCGKAFTKELNDSYPCIQIYNKDGELVNTVPHIYTGDEWKVVIPTIYDKPTRSWYKIYNTDREKVK